MPSRKFFIWAIVLVFILGLVGGAYLVLESTISRGEIVNSTDTKSSDELLNDLLKLNETESQRPEDYVPPEQKNLTEDFLKTIVDKAGLDANSAKIIESDDFFISTILPYLKSNQIELFPIIPDSVLKIVPNSKTSFSEYFKNTDPNAETLFNSMLEIVKVDPSNLDSAELEKNISLLRLSFKALSRENVPQKYVELHKNLLLTNYSLQKTAEAILNHTEDPLKSIFILNNTETLSNFWKNTFSSYQKNYVK